MIATTLVVVCLALAQGAESRPAPLPGNGTALAIGRLEAEVEALRQVLEGVLPGGRPATRPAGPEESDLESLGVDPGRIRRIRALEAEVLGRREALAALRLKVDPDLGAAASLGPIAPGSGGSAGTTQPVAAASRPALRLPDVEATSALRAGDTQGAIHAFEGRGVEGADPAAQYAVASAMVAHGRIEDAIEIFRRLSTRADRPLLQDAAERRLRVLEKKAAARTSPRKEAGR